MTLDREARVDALRSTAWFVAALVGGATGGALLWLSRPTVALGVVPGKGSSLRLAPQVGADRALATVGIEGEW